jgi:hypothetical protein
MGEPGGDAWKQYVHWNAGAICISDQVPPRPKCQLLQVFDSLI